jgi:hypothetical protein
LPASPNEIASGLYRSKRWLIWTQRQNFRRGRNVAKMRVYELAKDLGVETKAVMTAANSMGEFVRSASSTLEPAVVRRLREHFSPTSSQLTTPPAAVGPRVGPSFQGGQAARPVPGRNAEPRASAEPRSGGVTSAPPSAAISREAQEKAVTLTGLSSPRDLDLVIRSCKAAVERGSSGLSLDMTDATGFYPSVAVPVAAVLQHFRGQGVRVAMRGSSPILEKMSVRNPLEATPANFAEHETMSRVWAYFDHQQANYLTSAFMDAIRRKVACTTGVLEALEWCLYEVLDNVTQHAESGEGFAMMQLHTRSHRLAVAVADTGRGVQRSLAMSDAYKPRTAFDALTLAIEEGVTRNKVTNQGNGLFGLFRIIEQNGGRLTMRSGRGLMLLQGNRITGDNSQVPIGPENHGTFLDFQISTDRPVSMSEALNYKHVNDFLEGLESERGSHVVRVREHAGGAGSRAAARELRVFLENIHESGAATVELDFSGQAVVSSSFADEVIGKLRCGAGVCDLHTRLQTKQHESHRGRALGPSDRQALGFATTCSPLSP